MPGKKLPRAQLPRADPHPGVSKAKHGHPRHPWLALLLWGGGRADREGRGASSTISVSHGLWIKHTPVTGVGSARQEHGLVREGKASTHHDTGILGIAEAGILHYFPPVFSVIKGWNNPVP